MHGRSGFHNIIYAKHSTTKNSFAIVFNGNEGREITYGINNQDPTFAVQSKSTGIFLSIYFDLSNQELAKAMFLPLIAMQGKTAKIPPAWAFGHHMTVPQAIDQGLIKKIDDIMNNLKFPLEGIVQETQNLD